MVTILRTIGATVVIMLAATGSLVAAELSTGSKALVEANATMHQSMAMEMTGDVDVDFIRGMIPHHQGAIDMAVIVLKYGKDPEVKKLAEEIIAAQETEIAFMKAWLAKNGVPEGAPMDHSQH
jgi:uncharacterized protein (DUF305 family)